MQDATSEPERDTLLEADTVSDVLYLCLQLDGACADDVLDRARDAVATQVASLTTAAPDDDERAARAIESA
ncbi:hypothetical protein SB658_27150, partial [Bacillus sp. SIMBA_008]|uniref:hypothetical protein n=1 Tax=Bacillus sp. SIMBA_008 TaxID=3085757 RepID=UPI003979AE7B